MAESANREGREDFQRSLMQNMGLDDSEIAWRKQFLEFDAEDIDRLVGINELAQQYVGPVIQEFYDHLLSFEETKQFFRDQRVLEYVQHMQKNYFLRLTQGDYNTKYVEDRIKIGAVHERIGLPVKSYLGMYNFYLRTVMRKLTDAHEDDPDKAAESFLSLMKLVFLDIGLALDTYIFQREQTIRKQQEAIRELSTPVLQVRQGLLILPIVGLIDAQRARQLTEGLLHAINRNRARVVVIDITGVPDVDSQVANNLVQTVEASRLMGATIIITGLSPEIAQTMVTLGVDLSVMNTVGDLQGGIEEAERLLGLGAAETTASRLAYSADEKD